MDDPDLIPYKGEIFVFAAMSILYLGAHLGYYEMSTEGKAARD
jgi:hypothetical protein